jgi:hypothetical protein
MHRLRGLLFHRWFFGIQSDTDQTQRPTQNHFHLSMGKIRLLEDAFWSEKCWSYFSAGHVFFFPQSQTHSRGLS